MKPKIVVPTDFSESSLKGLDFAVQLAKKVGAKIMLHHIIEGFQDTRMYGNAQPSPEEKMMMNLMDIAAHKKMAEVTAQYQDTGVEIEMFVSRVYIGINSYFVVFDMVMHCKIFQSLFNIFVAHRKIRVINFEKRNFCSCNFLPII